MSDHLTNNHPSSSQPLSPLWVLTSHLDHAPVSHWDCSHVVVCLSCQKSLETTRCQDRWHHSPSCAVSRHLFRVKSPVHLDLSQSLGRHRSRWNILKTSTTPLDFMACPRNLLESTYIVKYLHLFHLPLLSDDSPTFVFTEALFVLKPCFNWVRQEPMNHWGK